jgi:hypothetical protein
MAIFNSYVKLPEGISFALWRWSRLFLRSGLAKPKWKDFYKNGGYWYTTPFHGYSIGKNDENRILDDFGFMAFTNILRPIHEHQRSCCSHLGSAHIFHGFSMAFPHIFFSTAMPGPARKRARGVV